MSNIKVLIADDSVVYRSQIRAALADIPGVEVVGAASNGKIALERLTQSAVDLLILDLEMPEMDGLQTLAAMKEKGITCKTLVFSSVSKRGAEITFEALRNGAYDFITKPGHEEGAAPATTSANPSIKIRALLEPKIQSLFPLAALQSSVPLKPVAPSGSKYPSLIWELFNPRIIVIGSSTGGPTVLEKIFSQITLPVRCPILIAQHMPPIFTATLAERLSKISGIPAAEGTHGAVLEANRIYVAPGDYHMSLAGTRDRTTIVLDQGPQVNSVRPAVDPLFSTAAAIFGERCLGIVLTGMGADGKVGAESIKAASGAVVIQSEASCVVFGMPGAVMASGAYDKVLNPDEIISELQLKAAGSRPKLRTAE